jgi:hypothetical protein
MEAGCVMFFHNIGALAESAMVDCFLLSDSRFCWILQDIGKGELRPSLQDQDYRF